MTYVYIICEKSVYMLVWVWNAVVEIKFGGMVAEIAGGSFGSTRSRRELLCSLRELSNFVLRGAKLVFAARTVVNLVVRGANSAFEARTVACLAHF